MRMWESSELAECTFGMSQNLFWTLPEPFLDDVSMTMMTNDCPKRFLSQESPANLSVEIPADSRRYHLAGYY